MLKKDMYSSLFRHKIIFVVSKDSQKKVNYLILSVNVPMFNSHAQQTHQRLPMGHKTMWDPQFLVVILIMPSCRAESFRSILQKIT